MDDAPIVGERKYTPAGRRVTRSMQVSKSKLVKLTGKKRKQPMKPAAEGKKKPVYDDDEIPVFEFPKPPFLGVPEIWAAGPVFESDDPCLASPFDNQDSTPNEAAIKNALDLRAEMIEVGQLDEFKR